MKKLFGLVAAALCVLAVTSCKLPETATTYSFELYKCTTSNYNTYVQPNLTVASYYPTADIIKTTYAYIKIYSELVTSDSNVSTSDLYNFLTNKGFSSIEATAALDNAPSIITCTLTDLSYPKGWIYIYKN